MNVNFQQQIEEDHREKNASLEGKITYPNLEGKIPYPLVKENSKYINKPIEKSGSDMRFKKKEKTAYLEKPLVAKELSADLAQHGIWKELPSGIQPDKVANLKQMAIELQTVIDKKGAWTTDEIAKAVKYFAWRPKVKDIRSLMRLAIYRRNRDKSFFVVHEDIESVQKEIKRELMQEMTKNSREIVKKLSDIKAKNISNVSVNKDGFIVRSTCGAHEGFRVFDIYFTSKLYRFCEKANVTEWIQFLHRQTTRNLHQAPLEPLKQTNELVDIASDYQNFLAQNKGAYATMS